MYFFLAFFLKNVWFTRTLRLHEAPMYQSTIYVVFFGNTLLVGRERNSSFEIEDDTGLNGE